LKPVVLFRGSLAEKGEYECASKYFDIVQYRSDLHCNELVIPRYSALPYYKELEYEVTHHVVGLTTIFIYVTIPDRSL